jgi:hypothetical protein
MPGHSRLKDGVLSHAYVPGIHVFDHFMKQNVDGRDKPGHNGMPSIIDRICATVACPTIL